MRYLTLLITILILAGCATNTVYVPDGKAVRLRAPVKNAKIWAMDKDGNPVAGKMTLPAGWYVLPLEE
jgi:uncharacterized lipoprotein YajG